VRIAPLSLALVLAAASCAGSASAQSAPSAECRRDLLVADSLVRKSRDRLLGAANATLAVQCPIWREHVEAARKAAAIHGRCSKGPERVRIQAELDETASDFAAQVKARCKGAL
jgi:hypothetical protein